MLFLLDWSLDSSLSEIKQVTEEGLLHPHSPRRDSAPDSGFSEHSLASPACAVCPPVPSALLISIPNPDSLQPRILRSALFKLELESYRLNSYARKIELWMFPILSLECLSQDALLCQGK